MPAPKTTPRTWACAPAPQLMLRDTPAIALRSARRPPGAQGSAGQLLLQGFSNHEDIGDRLPLPSESTVLFNIGGPYSRGRKERLTSSLLGLETRHIRCPRVTTLALYFGGVHPVMAMEELCVQLGLDGPEGARHAVELPAARLMVHPNPAARPLSVERSDPQAVLQTALILGLCSSTFFDPKRPVIWSTASLQKRLDLYHLGGMYPC